MRKVSFVERPSGPFLVFAEVQKTYTYGSDFRKGMLGIRAGSPTTGIVLIVPGVRRAGRFEMRKSESIRAFS